MSGKIFIISTWNYTSGPAYPSALGRAFNTFDKAKAFVEESAKAFARDNGYNEDEIDLIWEYSNHAELTYVFDSLIAYSIEKVDAP